MVESLDEDHDLNARPPKFRIRVTLPSNAKWVGNYSNRDIQSSDVRSSILRLKEAGHHQWADLEDIETPDDETLYLILKKQDVALWRETFPRSAASITFEGTETKSVQPAELQTNGPYAVKAYEREIQTTLVRRDNWHGGHVPIESAQLIVINDPSAAIAAYQAGDIDIIDITSETVGSGRQPNFDAFQNSFIRPVPTDRVYFIGMDTNGENTSNETTRQAVAAALDTSSIRAAGYSEEGAQDVFGVVPAHYPGGLDTSLDPSIGRGNIDLARQLLNEAGYLDGFETTLSVPELFGVPGQRMAEAARAQLASAGVLVRIQTLSTKNQWWLRDGEKGELFIDRTFASNDPTTTLERFQSESPFNTPGFKNEEFDSLLLEASNRTLAEESSEIFQRMQQILTGSAAVVPLAQPNNLWAVREGIVEPTFTPNGELGDIIDFEPVV
ncbi:ABC transporter substrate-binding protein [Ruegeria conchae]|uniref:ABC transporter substrate-binding protein n=1 Tax=Ruegeria conchae TaxID=981384 RepID=UPI0029C6F91E|nr:ABC transporter substrate-binding protein [Ruegeria conchae]